MGGGEPAPQSEADSRRVGRTPGPQATVDGREARASGPAGPARQELFAPAKTPDASAGSRSLGYDWRMDVLVGIANLVVLMIIIEGWVNGRIPRTLARTTVDRMGERLDDPASPVNARLDRIGRGTDDVGIRLDRIDRRLDDLETRLGGLDQRVGDLDARVAGFDTRLDRVEAQVSVLNAQTSQQLNDLDRRVRERLRGLDRHERAPQSEDGAGDGPS